MEDLLIRQLLVELKKSGFYYTRYSSEKDAVYPMDQRFPDVRIQEDTIIFRNLTESTQKREQELCVQKLHEVVDRTREIFNIWSTAPPLQIENVFSYRKLSQFGHTLFAARDDGERGLHFVTWQFNDDHTSIENGHYSDNYDWSKRDFAVRSGLIPESLNFTKTELMRVSSALCYQQRNDENLSYDEEAQIVQLTERARDAINDTALNETPVISRVAVDNKNNGEHSDTWQEYKASAKEHLSAFGDFAVENFFDSDCNDLEAER